LLLLPLRVALLKWVLRCFRWNRKRLEGLGTRWTIEQSLPPHPALSPGERENVRTLRQGSGNVGFDPTHRSSAPTQPDQYLHDRTPLRTRPFQTSRVVLPLPRGEGGVRGKGLACRFRLPFQPLAPASIPPKIATNLKMDCSVAAPGRQGTTGPDVHKILARPWPQIGRRVDQTPLDGRFPRCRVD